MISTRMATMTDLPDLVDMTNYSQSEIEKLGQDGMLLDINAAIDQYDEDGSIKAFWAEYFPTFLGLNLNEEGKMYTIPWLTTRYPVDGTTFNGWSHGISIRKDWLDKLEIEYKPVITAEEFKDICVAFREGDANGNGIADEVIALDPTSVSWPHSNLMTAFGFNKWISFNADTEEVICAWYTEGLKGYISYIKELIDAEVFDVSIIGHGEVASTLTSGNRAGAISDMHNETWVEPTVADENAEYLPVIITTDYGTYMNFSEKYGTNIVASAIPAVSENAEAVIDYMDWMFNPENMDFYMYGLEGEVATRNEKGAWTYLPKEEYTVDMSISALNLGLLEDARALPRWRVNKVMREGITEYSKNPLKNDFLGQVYDRKLDFEILCHELPTARPTQEEIDKLSAIENTLVTYMSETFSKLIVGDYSIEDYDSYVAEMEELGLKDYYEIQKNQIERFLNRK